MATPKSRAHLALAAWIKTSRDRNALYCGLNRALDISPQIGRLQLIASTRRLLKAGLDESAIEGTEGTFYARRRAAQDLPNSGASMPIITARKMVKD